MPHKGNGNGFGWQWRYVAFTLEEETTINVAVSASATSGQQWVSFGDYTIQTDNEANLAMIGYNIALNDAKLAKANDAYKNVTGAELTALNEAIAFETEGKTKKKIEDATTALQNATSAFKEAAPAYDAFDAILTKVENLNEAGKAKFAELTNAINEKFNDNSVKAEDLTDVEEYYFAAVKAQTTPNTDWTGLINNNSFEEGNINGWTNSGSVALGALNTSPANNPKVGNWFVEKWDTAGSVDFNQTISDLPAGYYKVTVRARNEADAVAYLYANDEKVAFVNNTTDTYSTNVVIANTGALKIGVSCENHPGNTWLAVDHFTLTYLGPVANMTITDAQWGTFYAPFDVTLPESAFAYTITVEDNKTVRNKVAEGGETVPANTAVLVYSASAINENFVGAPVAEAPVGLENALVGTLEPIASGDAPTGAYYLAKKNDVLNFYPAGQAKLAANRAYLVVPAGAKIEGLFEGEVTGINEVNAKNADSILRNIQGLPVNKGYNGIVIMDGKKYLKK